MHGLFEIIEGLVAAPDLLADTAAFFGAEEGVLAPAARLPKRDIINHYVNTFGGKVLHADQHPEFVSSIHRMAEEMKLDYKPEIAIVDRVSLGLQAFQHLPNAAALPGEGLIVINKALLDMSKTNLASAPNSGLKSFIAHEMAHLKHDALGVKISTLSPLLFPAAGLIGLAIYDRAVKNAALKNNPIQNIHEQIHQIADDEQKKLENEQLSDSAWKREPKIHKPLIEVGRYAAVGLLGLASAYMFQRHISLSREFRADKIAVEIGKDPEAYKQLLTKVIGTHEHAGKLLLEYINNLKEPIKVTIKDRLEYGRLYLEEHYTHAHPSLKERLSFIDKVAAEQAARNAASPGIA